MCDDSVRNIFLIDKNTPQTASPDFIQIAAVELIIVTVTPIFKPEITFSARQASAVGDSGH